MGIATDITLANDVPFAEKHKVITELGEAARSGVQDPREVVGGYVEAMLDLRRQAREAKRYDESDAIRDRLVDLGIEVRDTPDGAEWDLLAD